MKKFKFKWKKKYWVAVFFVVATATAVSVYFALQSSNRKSSDGSNPNVATSTSAFGVFPELKMQDFYKFVHVSDGKPFINDDMIAQLVNYVLSKATFTGGNIKWSFKFLDQSRQQLLLQFSWYPGPGSIFSTESREYRVTVHD